MDLDVGGVDHLVRDGLLLARMDVQQLVENTPVCPAQVEPIDAVPFSISLGKLVPDAARDEDPPDPIQSFSKIGRFSAFFHNVRFSFFGVKLIFLGLRRARLAWRQPNRFSCAVNTSTT